MFWFFQFQVVLALLLSVGFLVVAYRSSTPPLVAIVAALLVWIASVAGEALSDWQLERFKKDPANRGRVCQSGLWHYSRHPNYFFECLHWPVYLLLAIGSPWIWATLIPPAVMWFLLLKVSGIPMTEAQTAKSRPEYADYIRTTSAFIPWPPKAAHRHG
jgi:steroid 5-alpha reductase family enzyme